MSLQRLTIGVAIGVVSWSLLAVAASASTHPATGSCDRRAGATLVVNREVRVFQRKKYLRGVLASVSTYACNRQSGRLRYFQDAESGKDSGSTRRPTVAGGYVAYIAARSGPTGPIDVWNSQTGALRVQGTVAEADRRPDGSDPPVAGLVLTPAGHVAWMLGPTNGKNNYVIHAESPNPSAEAPVLASGSDIAPGSLAAAGGVVYWTQGGLARSSALP